MVFIIQHSQNKDQIALQLKLNELIAASQASNKLISVEDLNDDELELMKKFYEHLSGLTKRESQNRQHSIAEEDLEDAEDENEEIEEAQKKKNNSEEGKENLESQTQ
jgi:low affinity Fe/Cu permease